jgi:hypothetical protein
LWVGPFGKLRVKVVGYFGKLRVKVVGYFGKDLIWNVISF